MKHIQMSTQTIKTTAIGGHSIANAVDEGIRLAKEWGPVIIEIEHNGHTVMVTASSDRNVVLQIYWEQAGFGSPILRK
jgi:hypothetical protein